MNITQTGSVTTPAQAAATVSRSDSPPARKELQAALQGIENRSPLATEELQAQQEQAKKLGEQETKSLTEAANGELANLTTALAFSIDNDINRFIVKLVDTNSHETLRQYPAEEMVEVYKALKRVNELMSPDRIQGSGSLNGDLSSGVLFRGKA